MPLELLQITDSGVAYMVIGGFIVMFSMVSLLVKQRLYINEVVLGTACGIIFGPYCANVFNPRSWGGNTNTITLEVMRITLAAGLFAIGVELPRRYMAEHVKGLLFMVVPTMAFGWIIVAAVIFAIFPTLNFVSSLVIAACLTPTDPIISAAIVGGKFAIQHVPLNLRRIISAESAANDGLAYPFLSLSIYLTTEASRRVAIGKWFLVGWLYQVILGTVIGAVLGICFSFLLQFSHRKNFVDRESYIAQYLALALFTIGIVRTLGSDDLLAAFAAGTALGWNGHFQHQVEGEMFSSVIDLLLNCGCFVYIGAWLPFNMYDAPELGITPWRLVVLFVAVLVLRRIPPLLLLYKWVPEIETWKEALFTGHFGPMGVGAVFVSTLAVMELPAPQSPPQSQAEMLSATLQTIVSFVVLGSIIIHGLSIPFFSLSHTIGARTLSLTRTWTSRKVHPPHAPEWLNLVRRFDESKDVERAGWDYKVDHAGLTDARVISQDEAVEKASGHPELGPAAMLLSDFATTSSSTINGSTEAVKEDSVQEIPEVKDPGVDKIDSRPKRDATSNNGNDTQASGRSRRSSHISVASGSSVYSEESPEDSRPSPPPAGIGARHVILPPLAHTNNAAITYHAPKGSKTLGASPPGRYVGIPANAQSGAQEASGGALRLPQAWSMRAPAPR